MLGLRSYIIIYIIAIVRCQDENQEENLNALDNTYYEPNPYNSDPNIRFTELTKKA